MATKTKTNARTNHKGKATASKHAQERAQRLNHLAEAPAITRSNKRADRDRVVKESPLTGEDRPQGRRGAKQKAAEPQKQIERLGDDKRGRHSMRGFNQRGGQVVKSDVPTGRGARPRG